MQEENSTELISLSCVFTLSLSLPSNFQILSLKNSSPAPQKMYYYPIVPYTPAMDSADADDEITDISGSVRAVENLLEYSFNNKMLLEEALTHPSYTESASYQRLEFLGDAALGLALSNVLFLAHPDLDPGQLSLLRSANVSTEKFARVAVRHGLHRYVRHTATALDEKVNEFALAVQEEEDTVVHGGEVKAPKVLADIVESVAGAVYVDCNFDLRVFWEKFGRLLEPIVEPEILQKQPQPVTMLYELCHKDGRQVDIKHWRKREKDIASIYVGGQFIASASSENKDNAKLHAAREALKKLCVSEKMDVDCSYIDGTTKIDGAKQKLHELCGKKRWPKPCYRIVEESGPFHEKRYVCSVKIETKDQVLHVKGDEKSRVKDAENSAASWMIQGLRESKFT
ncbi:hypothetical protein RHMOL_Rhmol04G0019700 [Rhododendron molle]|uniref:Uncharacterized protein n=1 Tax=Rhododendron molle TaxID=49168 RepID=A0ACC0NXB8_RHOML|nr:hypothetical protein RHMOL_Rhmol04G0019700 [Rhododendron molle]